MSISIISHHLRKLKYRTIIFKTRFKYASTPVMNIWLLQRHIHEGYIGIDRFGFIKSVWLLFKTKALGS